MVGTTVVDAYLAYHFLNGRYARSSKIIVQFADMLAGEIFVFGEEEYLTFQKNPSSIS